MEKTRIYKIVETNNPFVKKIAILISIIFIFFIIIYVFNYSNFSEYVPDMQNPIETTTTTTQQTSSGPSGESKPSKVTLEIKNWGYNPDIIELSKGSTASWTNKDSTVHTVTSDGNFDSENIATGDSWSYTFNKAGTFEYRCKYSGFTAKVIIQ